MAKKFNFFNNPSRENLLTVIDHRAERIARLEAQNAELKARLEKLEAQLTKNSSTSWSGLHTACTRWLSYYSRHLTLGDEALLDAGVLPNCRGWVVHEDSNRLI